MTTQLERISTDSNYLKKTLGLLFDKKGKKIEDGTYSIRKDVIGFAEGIENIGGGYKIIYLRVKEKAENKVATEMAKKKWNEVFGKPDDSDSAKIAQRDIKNGFKDKKDVVRSVSNYEDEIKNQYSSNKYNGDCGCAHHVKEVSSKVGICLHYTAGNSAEGDVHTLFCKPREAVSYVVGRDGAIYCLFEDQYWGYHLGEDKNNDTINEKRKKAVKAVDGFAETNITTNNGKAFSKRSIGIEISNLGYLVETKENKGKFSQEESFKLQSAYRDHLYYESLPPLQMDAVCYLVLHLMNKHNIPNHWQVSSYNKNKEKNGDVTNQDYINYGSMFKTLQDSDSFKGVFTHTDWRFGKSDFPTEIILKIQSRFAVIEEQMFMAAYFFSRCEELRKSLGMSEEFSSNADIAQAVYREMMSRSCLPEDNLYTDIGFNQSPDLWSE